ncbi:MAG TPA: bifunctional oligoribonuclease/PAP phosphatase NrnA [Acidobacteriota bacterium]
MSLPEIADFIRRHNYFLITSHARPDGDALGSELGLALGLESIGKKVEVVNSDPHPSIYAELPGIEKILIRDRVPHLDFDAGIVLECGDAQRPEVADLDRLRLINIDHHQTNRKFGFLNWNDVSAAAVGQLIYYLLRELDIPMNIAIANNLYVALFTDTGSFQYSGTTAESLEVASALVRAGVDPTFAARIIYNSNPYEKVKLMGMVLNTLQRDAGGQIAWIFLTDEMLRQSGAQKSDTEGLVNYPLSVKDVRIAAFFREDGEGKFRISLRSKDDIDVARVAQHFGGGGHTNAAGFGLSGTCDQVVKTVLDHLLPLVQ